MRSISALFSLGAFLVASLSGTAYADTLSTWNGGSGNWSTAADWTPPIVPNNSGGTAYDVTIGSSGNVALDISPTINSLSLAGTLYGSTPASDQTLTVVNNATISGTVLFGDGMQGYAGGSLSVGGNLNTTSSAQMLVNGSLTVGGNFTNGTPVLQLIEPGGGGTFSVAGTLINQAGSVIEFGQYPRFFGPVNPPNYNFPIAAAPYPGPNASIGTLVNSGRIYTDNNLTLTNQPDGLTNIVAGSVFAIRGGTLMAGSNDGFAHLTTVDGVLDLEAQSVPRTITPQGGVLTVGTTGGLYLIDGNKIQVNGGVDNLGTLNTAQSFHGNGPNVLNVTNALTNAASGTLSVGSYDSMSAGLFVNRGTASFDGGVMSTYTLQNGGSISIQPNHGFGSSSLMGAVNVGLGAGAPGYNQFGNGILQEVLSGGSTYGTISDNAQATLDGELDVILQNGFTPTVGESFTILTFTPGDLTGAFSQVFGSFDDGQGYFVVSYDDAAGDVTITAEAAPEPGTFLLLLPVLLGFAWIARKHSQRA